MDVSPGRLLAEGVLDRLLRLEDRSVHGEMRMDGRRTSLGVTLVDDSFPTDGSDDRNELVELLLASVLAVVVCRLESRGVWQGPDLQKMYAF